MRNLIALGLIAASAFALPADAQAGKINTTTHNGPIIIKGPIDCEKLWVWKCTTDASGKKVCAWVQEDNCAIF